MYDVVSWYVLLIHHNTVHHTTTILPCLEALDTYTRGLLAGMADEDVLAESVMNSMHMQYQNLAHDSGVGVKGALVLRKSRRRV